LHDRSGLYSFDDWNSNGNADDQYGFLGRGSRGGPAYWEWNSGGIDDGESGSGELWHDDGRVDESSADGDGEQWRSDDAGWIAVSTGWGLRAAAE